MATEHVRSRIQTSQAASFVEPEIVEVIVWEAKDEKAHEWRITEVSYGADAADFMQREGRAIGDECVALMAFHDEAGHGGEICEDERSNLLAYIGHRIGMVPPDDEEAGERMVRNFIERLRDYHAFHHEHHDDEGHHHDPADHRHEH